MSNIENGFENFDDVLVGIKEIDDQHTKALELFNEILRAKNEKRDDDLMVVVKKLLEHWEAHFKYEEDIMNQYNYDGFDEHKKEHDKISNEFSNCEEMHSKGFKYVISCLALNLNLWIEDHIKHIKGRDKVLAEYLKGKGLT